MHITLPSQIITIYGQTISYDKENWQTFREKELENYLYARHQIVLSAVVTGTLNWKYKAHARFLGRERFLGRVQIN